MSLFALNHFVLKSDASEWVGAESRWVAAGCRFLQFPPMRMVREDCSCGLAAEIGFPAKRCPSCHAYSHPAPTEGCRCGFYAMRDLVPELVGAVARTPHWPRSGMVLGRVLLAGKVIEHDKGYRAERAKIAGLIPIAGTESAVMRLANKLDLPMGRAVEHV